MRTIRKPTNTITQAEKEEALWENIEGVAQSLSLSAATMAAILKTPLSTFNRWRRSKKIADDDKLRVEVIANFLRLAFNLEAMFTAAEDRRKWLQSPHQAFADQPPLELMKHSVEHLISVRSYLDYARGLGA